MNYDQLIDHINVLGRIEDGGELLEVDQELGSIRFFQERGILHREGERHCNKMNREQICGGEMRFSTDRGTYV